MSYFLTQQGNTFHESGTKVIFQDAHPTFIAYRNYLQANGEVFNYDGVHPSEASELAIEEEYQLYQKRKEDGINAYLKISAELRTAKLGGALTEQQHQAIEIELEPVRQEVVLGQWIAGKRKLVAIGQAVIGETMFNDLLTRITSYINDSY